jgi:pilus assembly protein CpaE
MTISNEPTRVLAIVDTGPTRQQIITALTAQNEFQLLDVLDTLEKFARQIRAAEPEIILIDHHINGQPTVDLIDDIALQFPQIPLVAILPEEDPVMAQQVTLAGARAFLVQPFTQVNLLSTLRRVRDLEARRQLSISVSPSAEPEEQAHRMKTIAVFSPRGGVGCSTVAANLAIGLVEATHERVLLLEGKLYFGHLDVMLNIRVRNTLADLIPHSNALDPNLIDDVVNEHASGIDVLLGPSDVQVAQGIRPEDLYNVVASSQNYYDYIVIDAGSHLSENTVTMLDAADKILLVTTPDLASLHDASRFIQISRSLAYPDDKLMVVVNRAGLEGGVRSRDIEGALRHELFAQILDDEPTALRSLNRGIPMLIKYPRSKISRSIKSLAETLVSQNPVKSNRQAGNPSKSRTNGRVRKPARTRAAQS